MRTIAAEAISADLARRKSEIDRALEVLVPSGEAWPSTLHRAIRHSLFAGGKRLRPILALAAAEAVGGEARPALEPACGLEMIHTYSLIHDDLPALDNDDLRRGVPTCHVVFGEAIAILAGDALLTHGLGLLARFPREEIYASAKLRALEIVVDAIGTTGMIGGQVADLEAPGSSPPSEEAVRAIHESKTGRLIRASLALGGILSFATEEDLARLDRYGRAVGLAFQIKDDLLDVESDAATLGKTPGKDAAAGKATFPAVWGIERSRQVLASTIEEAVAQAEALPGGGGRLPDLARFVGERKS
ncbi:MAG TPA: farnesyl diphosphate synthase [Thermoanaerobaculia bacterium]|nr:farnesyl diphosphate synthase [Thermoanaerobaculia bacterium]